VAGDVEQPPHRGGLATGFGSSGVDPGVEVGEIGRSTGQVGQAGQPAVGHSPDQAEHARLVAADPGADVVRGCRTAFRADHPVVLAHDVDTARCPVSQTAGQRSGREPPVRVGQDRARQSAACAPVAPTTAMTSLPLIRPPATLQP
jgi:hypothetical protein